MNNRYPTSPLPESFLGRWAFFIELHDIARHELVYLPYREALRHLRDADLLLFRRRGLISIAGRGDHSHAAKAAWWGDDLADWLPSEWNQMPPRATALESVDDGPYLAADAAAFIEGFNNPVLRERRPIWAIAIPVTLCYQGDASVGMPVVGYLFDRPAAPAETAEASEPTDAIRDSSTNAPRLAAARRAVSDASTTR